MTAPPPVPAPTRARHHLIRLAEARRVLSDLADRKRSRAGQLAEYLALAPAVDAALDQLSEQLFGKLSEVLEHQLTFALQEILNQPIRLKVERDVKRGSTTMRFEVERNGEREDIMKGMGGSVANILSIGLRIFALSQLDPARHRRFLVLDEQDCWLAPELIPRLVNVISAAARELKYQIILISHHDVNAFAHAADKVYRFVPTAGGVKVEEAF